MSSEIRKDVVNNALNSAASALEDAIAALRYAQTLDPSRELALAITNIEQAGMWFSKADALRGCCGDDCECR